MSSHETLGSVLRRTHYLWGLDIPLPLWGGLLGRIDQVVELSPSPASEGVSADAVTPAKLEEGDAVLFHEPVDGGHADMQGIGHLSRGVEPVTFSGERFFMRLQATLPPLCHPQLWT